MKFKEQVATDITSVFINTDEFGEEHEIDGEMVKLVFDDDTNRERSNSPYEDGTFQNSLVFFVKHDDLGYMPEQYQHMSFDGKPGIIKETTEEMGIVKVVLELNET